MRLLVDDIRDPEQYGAHVTFRTANDFLNLVEKDWDIDILFLDHDLGIGKTGYDVIVALVEAKGIFPKEVHIVSSNPVGVENIGRCLVHNGYKKSNNREFKRIMER